MRRSLEYVAKTRIDYKQRTCVVLAAGAQTVAQPVTRQSPPNFPAAEAAPEKTTSTAIASTQTESTEDSTNPLEPPLSNAAQTNEAPASAKPLPPSGKSIPQRFGSYELVWEICRDALSTTHAARREGIDRLLSVRIFNARVTDSAQIRSIQKAAGKAAELTHPNHVTVYENGVGDNGAPYVVTEWIEGDSLVDVFQVAKRLDVARFLNIFNQVCEALIEAHSRQLTHGNLSPNKIVLSNEDLELDVVKLIDFGMPPDPVQNAFYLSPEQCLDKSRVDGATDIYSLGCIMYEALVGTPPFVGHKMSPAALNYLHELSNQYSPASPEHNALKLLDCIIIKCLQKDRCKRFRSVRELMDALRLVNDCICNGNTRKLPPKAEKLLLFSFLDLFDKKLAACLSAYLILGFVSLKYLGEIQLQRSIDAAQLAARLHDLPGTQAGWKEAIRVAEQTGKPPSLQADLHWELGDTYEQLRWQATTAVNKNDLAHDAITQYEQALKYFNNGPNYRSYALDLSSNITRLATSMDDSELQSAQREDVLKEAKKLFAGKKFAQCSALCRQFLRSGEDKDIALYAVRSFNELGIVLPLSKGLRCFEDAVYYSTMSEDDKAAPVNNLNLCIAKLGMIPNSVNTRKALAAAALEAGDDEAAAAEIDLAANALTGWEVQPIEPLRNRFIDYRNLRKICYRLDGDPNMRKAIQPLESSLKIEESTYGIHSERLAPTLSSLANCYRLASDNQRAIATYKRLFSLAPYNYDENAAVLAYADLLARKGDRDQARRVLEKNVLLPDGTADTSSPLYIRLLIAYADDKLTQQLHLALSRIVSVPEPDRTKPTAPRIVERWF